MSGQVVLEGFLVVAGSLGSEGTHQGGQVLGEVLVDVAHGCCAVYLIRVISCLITYELWLNWN